MTAQAFSYIVETDIPSTYAGKMLAFISKEFLRPQPQRFADLSRSALGNEPLLTFNVLDFNGARIIRAEIVGGKSSKITITPLVEMVSEKTVDEIKQDIIIAIEFFEQKVRENTLFFAWREGETIVPEQASGKEKKSINRLFLETQVLFFVLFITLGIILFMLIGIFVPIVLLALQFVFVFYSGKIIARSADWRITANNPTIHLLEYRLPVDDQSHLKEKIPKEKLAALKKEIYEQTILKKGEVDCKTAQEIFPKYGLECDPENLTARKVDAYQLVKKTADKFGYPMPEVVVSNTLVPNAAASGPSPSRGIVLLTTGLFVSLKDDEILSVLGHEFGHLKGRDPLILYGLTSLQYLLTFYVIFPLFPWVFYSLLFFVYFWAVMTIIYFIAKFFEARADLASAIVVGQPQVLAEALEEIGFKRLLFERVPAYRVQEWISLDPHPPMYFRVARLRKLRDPWKIRYPLFQSAKDVVRGFFGSLS